MWDRPIGINFKIGILLKWPTLFACLWLGDSDPDQIFTLFSALSLAPLQWYVAHIVGRRSFSAAGCQRFIKTPTYETSTSKTAACMWGLGLQSNDSLQPSMMTRWLTKSTSHWGCSHGLMVLKNGKETRKRSRPFLSTVSTIIIINQERALCWIRPDQCAKIHCNLLYVCIANWDDQSYTQACMLTPSVWEVMKTHLTIGESGSKIPGSCAECPTEATKTISAANQRQCHRPQMAHEISWTYHNMSSIWARLNVWPPLTLCIPQALWLLAP